ncbi:MAG: hypothetical protein WCV50_06155 [Patescibacteria group bacterium]
MKHKLALLVMVALAFFATGAGSQYVAAVPTPADSSYLEQFVGKPYSVNQSRVWLDICALNRDRFPDSNKVQPGDTIRMPLGKTYVAQSGAADHMWTASVSFMGSEVMPYLMGFWSYTHAAKPDTQPNAPKTTTTVVQATNYGWWCWQIVGLIIVGGIIIAILLLNRNRKRNEESAKSASEQLERNRRFVPDPPDFEHSQERVVAAHAEDALRRTLGPNFKRVGPVVKGKANGTLTAINADGTTQTQQFNDELAYAMDVEGPDGTRFRLFCRWGCFNLVAGSVGASFVGTFSPIDGSTPMIVPAMTSELIDKITQKVRGDDIELSAAEFPGAVTAEVTPTIVTPVKTAADAIVTDKPKSDGIMRFTKVQLSAEKGINLEGDDICLSVDQLFELVYQVTGRLPKEVKQAKDATASDPAHPDD